MNYYKLVAVEWIWNSYKPLRGKYKEVNDYKLNKYVNKEKNRQ